MCVRNVRGVQPQGAVVGLPWPSELEAFDVAPVLDGPCTGISCRVDTGEHQRLDRVSGNRRLVLEVLELGDGLRPGTPGHHELTNRW